MPSVAPTLADVARMAGVSEITVSRVVRNKQPVSGETRSRVTAAINALGYIPNRAAGSLASAGAPLIGVLLPSLSNIVFPEVLRGIQTAVAPTIYQSLVGVTDYDPVREQHLIYSLLAWKPAALILTGFDHTQTTRDIIARSGVRVAELMDIDAEPIGIAIGLSHRKAGYDSGRHLVERGYRRFGYVGHDWDADRRARRRYDGLCAALAEAGLSLVAKRRSPGPSSTLAGKEILEELLTEQPELDVVVFSNDDMAIGGFFHCLAAGIAVKERLGLFGFNGLNIGQDLPLPLSTVRSNRFMIGKTAVERLLDTAKLPDESRIIDMGYVIVEGATA